mgnify:CR=1 FL=1
MWSIFPTWPQPPPNESRFDRPEEVCALLQKAFEQQPRSHWQQLLRKAGILCGVLRVASEAIRSPEARERRVVTRVSQLKLGWVPNVSLPIRYSDTPLADPTLSPRIGEHIEFVLADRLSLDSSPFRGMAEAGSFGGPATPSAAGTPATERLDGCTG